MRPAPLTQQTGCLAGCRGNPAYPVLFSCDNGIANSLRVTVYGAALGNQAGGSVEIGNSGPRRTEVRCTGLGGIRHETILGAREDFPARELRLSAKPGKSGWRYVHHARLMRCGLRSSTTHTRRTRKFRQSSKVCESSFLATTTGEMDLGPSSLPDPEQTQWPACTGNFIMLLINPNCAAAAKAEIVKIAMVLPESAMTPPISGKR